MKKVFWPALAIAASLACTGGASAQIKIGVGGPMTGPNAAFGAQLKNGAEQAAEDINAKGGINGQKIELTFGDDVSDPKQGVSVANKFVGEGVKFVIGHFNSGVTIPASDVYAENGIFMITPSATNPTITTRGLWNVFRTCGDDDNQGNTAAKYIAAKYKGKKVAVVHDKTTYGKGLADFAKKYMNQLGVKEVLYEGVNTGEKDYLRSRLQDQAVRRRARLLGRPAHRRRPDRAPDARPGRQGSPDGRRRHHVGRVRLYRWPGRGGDLDDLPGRARATGRRRRMPSPSSRPRTSIPRRTRSTATRRCR